MPADKAVTIVSEKLVISDLQEVIPDLEKKILDDIAISDDPDHKDEEGCELQVLNKYSNAF